MSSVEEAQLDDPWKSSFILLAEVSEVIKQLLSGKVPWADKIRPEMLKALDPEGLSRLTCLFIVTCRSGKVPMDWQTGMVVPVFKKGTGGCAWKSVNFLWASTSVV